MTRILNTLRTAALAFDGVLLAELRSPLIDTLTTPDTLYLPSVERFNIVGGSLDINLPATEAQGISYKLGFYRVSTQYNYYFPDSTPYLNPGTHLHTDGNYYTGFSHTLESELLQRQTQEILTKVWEIETQIPLVTEIELSRLLPTGITSDTLAEGAAFVAELLAKNYSATLTKGVLNFRDNYQVNQYYLDRDVVFYAGSSWRLESKDPVIGIPPILGSTIWKSLALKGDSGGTGGLNLPFSSGWQNNYNAPSLHDVWTELSNRPTAASLGAKAPIENPAFLGAATYLTQALGLGKSDNPNKTRIATLEYAYAEALDAVRRSLIGFIFETSTVNPPQYTVRANGQALSRVTYSGLWAIAQSNPAYGVGNGATTFTVPNRSNPTTNTYYVVWTGV